MRVEEAVLHNVSNTPSLFQRLRPQRRRWFGVCPLASLSSSGGHEELENATRIAQKRNSWEARNRLESTVEHATDKRSDNVITL